MFVSPLPNRAVTGIALPLLLLLLVVVAAVSPRVADEEDTGPSLRILMVGNSLTLYNDLPTTLEHLLETAGYDATPRISVLQSIIDKFFSLCYF